MKISSGTKTSYAAYARKFEYEKEKGFINPKQRKFTLEEYADQAARMKSAGVSNPSQAILEQQENFTAAEAREQRKDLAKIKGFNKGPIEFEYNTDYEYRDGRPIATRTQRITIDFSGKTVVQQRDLIRTLPREAMVPMLMALGYTRDEALEWIGY